MKSIKERLEDARQDAWVSISAYARLYGVHRNTAAKMVKEGTLKVWRAGKTVRIRNVPPDKQQRSEP